MQPLHLLVPFSIILSCSPQPSKDGTSPGQEQPAARIGGPCECCEGIHEDRPDFLRGETTLAGESEPGERLRISGHILLGDGSPAAGVILYVYHTNSEGRYEPAAGQTGCARRHGHLRGWMQSDETGRYAFSTILPGSYPNSAEPRHIHAFILEPGKNEYWIDSFVFDNDPYLTDPIRQRYENRGGNGIIHLAGEGAGPWTGQRDIVLGKNIPGY